MNVTRCTDPAHGDCPHPRREAEPVTEAGRALLKRLTPSAPSDLSAEDYFTRETMDWARKLVAEALPDIEREAAAPAGARVTKADWPHGYQGMAERMFEVWQLSGRLDPFDGDMEAWRGFALAVMAKAAPPPPAEPDHD